MAKDVERRLLINRLPADKLPEIGDGAVLDLARPINAYQDDWILVSHTFEVLPDESGLLTVLLERPSPEAP